MSQLDNQIAKSFEGGGSSPSPSPFGSQNSQISGQSNPHTQELDSFLDLLGDADKIPPKPVAEPVKQENSFLNDDESILNSILDIANKPIEKPKQESNLLLKCLCF